VIADPTNPVVALCAEGMREEGTPATARACFERAWAIHRDDYEACIAAHFLARHQPTPALALEWNRRALEHAERVRDGRAAAFLPSLLLNLGDALLGAGRVGEASLAAERARLLNASLPRDGYRDFVARGIENLLARARYGSGDAGD
jgi:hypothetical protein